MNPFVAFLSPLALLLPAIAGQLPAARDDLAVHEAGGSGDAPKGLDTLQSGPFDVFRQVREPPPLGQVRIEQRMVIRISPGTAQAREQMMADLRSEGRTVTRYEQERLRGGCVAISGIAAVQPWAEQNRLLLFMRDRRVLSASLERACNARDYYSGFYVERNEDGQLCARRDLLQSRAGASCKVAQLHRLVAVRD